MRRSQSETTGQYRKRAAPTFAMAVWSSFSTLVRIDELRLEVGFPQACQLMRFLQQETVSLLGALILHDRNDLHPLPTIQQCGQASLARSAIMAELKGLPDWIVARLSLLTTHQTHYLERALNCCAELYQELAECLGDQLFFDFASRLAETSLKCQFRQGQGPNTRIAMHPSSPSSSRPPSQPAPPMDGATLHGLIPRMAPNLALTLAPTPAPTAPSTTSIALSTTDMGLDPSDPEDEW